MSETETIVRYASVHLTVDKTLTMPSATTLPTLLKELGLHDQTQEALWVITYDSIQNIRTVVEVGRGNYHEMDVSIPAVLSIPLLTACDRFEIAHNHPSIDTSPTVLDVDMTRKVLAAANTCGLYFEDHVILSPSGEYYSFFESGKLGPGRTIARGHQRAS